MIKKILLVLFLSLSLIFSTNVHAQEATSSTDLLEQINYEPDLLPTSPFYFLKTWKEKIEIAFARTPQEKIEKRIEFANRRLAELRALASENPDRVERLSQRYQEELNLIQNEVKNISEQERDRIMEHVAEVTLKHQEILLDNLEKAPEKAQKGLENALDNSLKGYQQAVEVVTEEKKGQIEVKVEQKVEQVIRKAESVQEKVENQEQIQNTINQLNEIKTRVRVRTGSSQD